MSKKPSNWIVDVERMLLVNIGKRTISDIKYENRKVYAYWQSGAYDGWEECVEEIKQEYLEQVEIYIEKQLLGELGYI